MKKPYAFGILLASLAGICLIGAALGTNVWAVIQIEKYFTGNSTETTSDTTTTCEIKRTVGIFTGSDESSSLLCGSSSNYNSLNPTFVSYNELVFYAVIVMCAVSALMGLIVVFVAIYNLFSRPYESWAGPVGLLSYFTIGLVFTLVAVILFVVSGYTDLTDSVPQKCEFEAESTVCKDESYEQVSFAFGYSFYILVGALGPFLLGIVLVILAGQTLQKKLKNSLCPRKLEEPEIQEGKDDNIMMF